AVQLPPPLFFWLASAATFTPHTFAATLIGACTVIGTFRLLSAAICVSLRKLLRISTFCTGMFTVMSPPALLTCDMAGEAARVAAAAANIMLRIRIRSSNSLWLHGGERRSALAVRRFWA